jgi:hypothetical protein
MSDPTHPPHAASQDGGAAELTFPVDLAGSDVAPALGSDPFDHLDHDPDPFELGLGALTLRADATRPIPLPARLAAANADRAGSAPRRSRTWSSTRPPACSTACSTPRTGVGWPLWHTW